MQEFKPILLEFYWNSSIFVSFWNIRFFGKIENVFPKGFFHLIHCPNLGQRLFKAKCLFVLGGFAHSPSHIGTKWISREKMLFNICNSEFHSS